MLTSFSELPTSTSGDPAVASGGTNTLQPSRAIFQKSTFADIILFLTAAYSVGLPLCTGESKLEIREPSRNTKKPGFLTSIPIVKMVQREENGTSITERVYEIGNEVVMERIELVTAEAEAVLPETRLVFCDLNVFVNFSSFFETQIYINVVKFLSLYL